MSLRASCLFLAGLVGGAVVLFGAYPAAAQEKRDLLKDAEARQKVELQRVQTDFDETNREVDKLSPTNPAKAVELLKSLRDRVQSNTDIPATDRDSMLRKIDRRIVPISQRANEIPAPIPNPIGTARRQEDARKPDETKRVAQATQRISDVARAKSMDDYIKDQKRQGFLAVVMDNERAAIPQVNDITFPKDWLERTKKRSQINMTEAEKKILKALDTPMDIDLKDSTLEAVIDYLHDKSGVTTLVPQVILDEKAITYKTPISVSLKKVTMRTILKKVLGDVGLVYIIKDGVIQATTEERAKQTLTTRVYYIGDLIGLTAYRPGSFRSQAAMMTAVNDIIGMVVSTQPDSWWLNGGPGTIAFDPRTMSLVVRQTSEIHYQLGLTAGGR